MRKFFIPIFVAVLFFDIFGLVNLAETKTPEEICADTYEASGKSLTANQWCSYCGPLVGCNDVYDFCKDGRHVHFECNPGPGECLCDPNSDLTWDEPCTECFNWTCNQGCDCEGNVCCLGGFCCQCSTPNEVGCRRGICDQSAGSIEMYIVKDCEPDECVDLEEVCEERDECKCGNGIVESGEKCDPGDPDIGIPERLTGETCESLGYGPGELHCGSNCRFDPSGCESPPNCGDGVLDPYTEDCEIDLDSGELIFSPEKDTCQEVDSKYVGGTLGCTSCNFDLSKCEEKEEDGGGGGGVGITIKNPLEAESLEELIDGIINFLFNLALVLVPVMIVIAGFLFVIAAGDTEKISQAKRLILYTLIGFGIILISKGLIELLKQFF